jgi:uncharacterized protein (DUF2384 family)
MIACNVGAWTVVKSLETSNHSESDAAELAAMARDTFKTEADADGWMREEHPLLDGQSPFMAAQTKAGAKRVSEILTAIKWGGAV